MATITLTSPVKKDKYTDYIETTFDYVVKDSNVVDIPFNVRIEKLGEWNIGLIVGASGSGKATIQKKLGGGAGCKLRQYQIVDEQF